MIAARPVAGSVGGLLVDGDDVSSPVDEEHEQEPLIRLEKETMRVEQLMLGVTWPRGLTGEHPISATRPKTMRMMTSTRAARAAARRDLDAR